MVRKERFELSTREGLASETSAYANSATSAQRRDYFTSCLGVSEDFAVPIFLIHDAPASSRADRSGEPCWGAGAVEGAAATNVDLSVIFKFVVFFSFT